MLTMQTFTQVNFDQSPANRWHTAHRDNSTRLWLGSRNA